MPVNLHPRTLSSFRSRAEARASSASKRTALASLLLLALVAACGEPEDGDMPVPPGGFMQGGNPALGPDAGFMPVVAPEAGAQNPFPFDAGMIARDAGTTMPGPFDAGSLFPPAPDSGAAHDGGVFADAGPSGDAGAADASMGDAGPCASLTYASFGQQFIMTYCYSCHSGTRPQHNISLDTLANVQKNKAAVKREAVTMMAMPPQNPRPTAAERMKLGQWIDCGPN